MSGAVLKETGQVTMPERVSYVLYFLGQNVFFFLTALFLNTYFTDVGIPTAIVGIIALIVKVFDAVNDPIFGGMVDKVEWKKGGKFVPWLKMGIGIVFIATILIFAIPRSASTSVKVAWAILAYCLWSVGYTMNDVPIFGLITTITSSQNERTQLNASGRVAATAAMMACLVVIPGFRNAIGGWTATVVLLSIISAILMFPISLTAKERIKPTGSQAFKFKDMVDYLVHNKYLLIYYIAFLIYGMFNVVSTWAIYISRYCIGGESYMPLYSVTSNIAGIVIGLFAPALCRKIDKFKIFHGAVIFSVLTHIIRLLTGYSSRPVALAAAILVSIPYGFFMVFVFMFTPDCAEYGHYKTGKSYPGITFSTQTFFAKMQSALLSFIAGTALAFIGFISGEGAAQVEGFADKLWTMSCVLPIIGCAVASFLLFFYKLNDHDVQLMMKVNAGEMSRKEAEMLMKNKY